MAAQCYLGVDGGGSSTQFLLEDDAGTVLLSYAVGSTSKKSVGAECARANIARGYAEVLEACRMAGVEPENVWGAWGLSGCDTEEDRRSYERMLAGAGVDLSRHFVVNDSILALRTCTPGPGIVVIAGTGSIAVGVRADGRLERLGGWSYQASDLGSGAWFGSQVLREALLFDEGCRGFDPAFPLVNDMLGCETGELGPAIAQLQTGSDFARFAQLALEAEGSPVCDAIRAQGAGYLAAYVHSIATRLSDEMAEDAFLVVLSGGLFKNKRFADMVAGLIARDGIPLERIRVLDESPTRGGIALAQARAYHLGK